MKDRRIKKLSDVLLDYCVDIKKGDNLYLEWRGVSTSDLVETLIAGTIDRGATPFWIFHDEGLLKAAIQNTSIGQIKEYARLHSQVMKQMQCYISVNGSDDPFGLEAVPAEKMKWFMKYFFKPLHLDFRVNRTRWCVLRWPSKSMAQMAQMSHENFTDFYFDVCLVDYKKMSREMGPIVKLMRKTDKVRIVSPETDITFSIKNIPVMKSDGHFNIPDGEVFTAPIVDSANGTIRFNAPTRHHGTIFSDVTMTFKNGRAEKIACSGNTRELNKIFDTDKGARFIGEFAIGLNPKIKRTTKDILFDEKIDGSIHLALGQCYDKTPNGNESALHWDLVLIQTPEYGGGELYFDGKLVRKNGKFV